MEADPLCRDGRATVSGLARQPNRAYCRALGPALYVWYVDRFLFCSWKQVVSWPLLVGGTEVTHYLALVYKESPQDFCFASFMVIT